MIEEMKSPAKAPNVGCDWCEGYIPSTYTKQNKNGIRYYSCEKHRELLEQTLDQFKKAGQHLSRIR